MPEGFFVTESCMIRDIGNTDFGPPLVLTEHGGLLHVLPLAVNHFE